MRYARFLEWLLLASVLTTAACDADRSTAPADTLESRVNALGFSSSGMQDHGSYVVVEGDIRLEKAILLGLVGSTGRAPSPGIQPPQTATTQYSTTTTVSSAYISNIRVDLSRINTVSNWASAVGTAISAFNAISNPGTAIYMYEATPGDITFYTVGSADYIALASFPVPGYGAPGNTVWVNTQYNNGLTLNQKEWVMAHELGHTIGLRHDNAPAVEPDEEGAGMHRILGTPVTDPNSVMQKYYSGYTWVGFGNYDMKALRILYPAPT